MNAGDASLAVGKRPGSQFDLHGGSFSWRRNVLMTRNVLMDQKRSHGAETFSWSRNVLMEQKRSHGAETFSWSRNVLMSKIVLME